MLKNWTLGHLFELAIQAEQTAAAVYQELSEMFADYRTISEFWIAMRDDEYQHAAALEEIQRQLSADALVATPDASAMTSAQALILQPADQLLKHVHNLNDACQLAHDMEYSEVNTLFLYLRTELIPSAERRDLAYRAIHQHQGQLIAFSRQFGDDQARKTIVAKRKAAQTH